MNSQSFSKIAARLLRHPTAPYFEQAVIGEIEAICAEHSLPFECDRFGNVLVRWQTSRVVRPLVLTAHTDHPGFHLIRRVSNRKCVARFRGTVGDPYFRLGTRVRVEPGAVRAALGRRLSKERQFELLAEKDLPPEAVFAVWDLPGYVLRNGRIIARGCDDVLGVAVVLATLIELKRARVRANVIGVLSRAEEVGFHGALVLAAEQRVPRRSLVVSLETSRELPGAKMGQGVILRVGDRVSIFDAEAMRFLTEVAARLKARRKDFSYQRALMSGGACEATAYQHFGYQTGAVCVALGNYHNCGPRSRIAAEYVDLTDVCSMVDLLLATAREMARYRQLVAKVPKRLEKLLAEARREFATRGVEENADPTTRTGATGQQDLASPR